MSNFAYAEILLGPDGKLPTRAHPGDLGYDIYAAETVDIGPRQTMCVRTDIRLKFDDAWGAQLRDRSSMAVNGIFVHAGIIDSGYTGEIKVVLYNSTKFIKHIDKHAKIAQLLFAPVITARIDVISEEEFNAITTSRGADGFGSTGK